MTLLPARRKGTHDIKVFVYKDSSESIGYVWLKYIDENTESCMKELSVQNQTRSYGSAEQNGQRRAEKHPSTSRFYFELLIFFNRYLTSVLIIVSRRNLPFDWLEQRA